MKACIEFTWFSLRRSCLSLTGNDQLLNEDSFLLCDDHFKKTDQFWFWFWYTTGLWGLIFNVSLKFVDVLKLGSDQEWNDPHEFTHSTEWWQTTWREGERSYVPERERERVSERERVVLIRLIPIRKEGRISSSLPSTLFYSHPLLTNWISLFTGFTLTLFLSLALSLAFSHAYIRSHTLTQRPSLAHSPTHAHTRTFSLLEHAQWASAAPPSPRSCGDEADLVSTDIGASEAGPSFCRWWTRSFPECHLRYKINSDDPAHAVAAAVAVVAVVVVDIAYAVAIVVVAAVAAVTVVAAVAVVVAAVVVVVAASISFDVVAVVADVVTSNKLSSKLSKQIKRYYWTRCTPPPVPASLKV